MHGGSEATRLDRVETEISGLKADIGGLKADMRGFGEILTRIEDGIVRAQAADIEKEQRNKPPVVAVVSILITIILSLIGGAYFTGTSIGRLDERSISQQRELRHLYTHVGGREDAQPAI